MGMDIILLLKSRSLTNAQRCALPGQDLRSLTSLSACVRNHIAAPTRTGGECSSQRSCQTCVAEMRCSGFRYVPTGFQSKELIVKAGLNLGDVDQFPNIDVTIDGADEVDVSDIPCCSLAENLD